MPIVNTQHDDDNEMMEFEPVVVENVSDHEDRRQAG